MPSPSLRSYLNFFLTVGALWGFSGCASDQPAESPKNHVRTPPPPPLAGRDVFFNNMVAAEIKLGAGFGPVGEPGSLDQGGGGHHRGGGGMHGGGGGGHHRGGGGGDDGGGDPANGDPDAPRIRTGGGGPPILIHIQLTNQGPTAIVVSAPDFSSMLGNFVVFPETLALAPGQSAEFEPMTSRLGASFAEVTVNLTLSLNDHQEKKGITLHQMAVPPPAETPSSPADPAK